MNDISIELAKIPKSVIKKYRMQDVSGYALHIHHPSFINVNYDNLFKVEVLTETISIRNTYVNITIWPKAKEGRMHVTVYTPLQVNYRKLKQDNN